jgi:UDP-3-O-[3-hydroxymyristoyl] N-acetylglucosamine deacetylase
MNPEGLRFADEFVRHKMLDAIGDLALAGLPIVGAYRSYCGGHRLNVAALEELFADAANYVIVDGAAGRSSRYGETAARMSAAAYAPDMR